MMPFVAAAVVTFRFADVFICQHTSFLSLHLSYFWFRQYHEPLPSGIWA